MTKDLIVFDYQGAGVAFDVTARMWNLNAMCQAAGGEPNKAPRYWLRQEQAQELIAALTIRLNCDPGSQFIETREGRSGGTWAHWQIAAAYAHYLRPDFYLQWNEWAMERITNRPINPLALPAPHVAGVDPRLWHAVWPWAQAQYARTAPGQIAFDTRDLTTVFGARPSTRGKYIRLLADALCGTCVRSPAKGKGQPPMAVRRAVPMQRLVIEA